MAEGSSKILMHRNECNLHLRLTGSFDGTTALQLVKMLEKYACRFSKIFIHTGSIRNVVPAACAFFAQGFDKIRLEPAHIIVTGEKAFLLLGK